MPLTATSAPRTISASAQALKLFRTIHLYVGVFIAPMLLFFAFTGAVQTLSLHEAAADYKAPDLLMSLGQIHKNQTYLLPGARKPAGPGDAKPAAPSQATATPAQPPSAPSANSRPRQQPTLAKKQREHLPLKIFFVLVSLSLFVSTATGVYMAYKYNRKPLLITALLIAGVAVPIILVGF